MVDSSTGVKAAVCFYPLLTDLLNDAMVRVLLEHLEDTGEFATPFPVPSTSLDDPLFDSHAEWNGKRHAAGDSILMGTIPSGC